MCKAVPHLLSTFTHAHIIQSRMLRPSVCFSTTALGVSRVIYVPSCVPQVPVPPLHYPQGNTVMPPNHPAACPMTPGSQDHPFSTPDGALPHFQHPNHCILVITAFLVGFGVHKLIGQNLKCIINVLCQQQDDGYRKTWNRLLFL